MNVDDIDILTINNNILQELDTENDLEKYENKLKLIQNQINTLTQIPDELTLYYNRLKQYIKQISENTTKKFYLAETLEIIEAYKKILNEPIYMNFGKKQTKSNTYKKQIIDSYMEIAAKYTDLTAVSKQLHSQKTCWSRNEVKGLTIGSWQDHGDVRLHDETISCKHCKNKADFEIVDNSIYICLNCSSQQIIMQNISSYIDIDRVNLQNKYAYDRRVHFKESINNYQGVQNTIIPENVYEELENQFHKHHLLINSDNKETKFKNITKEHIRLFLKELKFTKHYENINLIHYNLTGIKPDDISHLEDILLVDFDILSNEYDKLCIDRKSFINAQLVLYSLLMKHNHACIEDDFSILKTNERRTFHDTILQTLFERLNWTYVPLK